MNAACGPVTRRIVNSDGSSEETTFSCPADAASYDRVNQQMPNRIPPISPYPGKITEVPAKNQPAGNRNQ